MEAGLFLQYASILKLSDQNWYKIFEKVLNHEHSEIWSGTKHIL